MKDLAGGSYQNYAAGQAMIGAGEGMAQGGGGEGGGGGNMMAGAGFGVGMGMASMMNQGMQRQQPPPPAHPPVAPGRQDDLSFLQRVGSRGEVLRRMRRRPRAHPAFLFGLRGRRLHLGQVLCRVWDRLSGVSLFFDAKMRRIFAALRSLGLGLLLSGADECGLDAGSKNEGEPCTRSVDCLAPLVCLGGECRAEPSDGGPSDGGPPDGGDAAAPLVGARSYAGL